ncbi:unnamed protein product, partial [Polarella glacialis]
MLRFALMRVSPPQRLSPKSSRGGGRFSLLLAAGEARAELLESAEKLACSGPTPAETAQQKPARRRTEDVAISAPCAAKLLAVLVAPKITSLAEAAALERCIRSISVQTSPPRALWISWHAPAYAVQLAVSKSLDDLSGRCIRRGMPLTQVQLDEHLGPWRHIEGVLQRRRKMGGDVCDVWVVLGHASELWHPERCARLCSAAAAASGPSLWLPGACKMNNNNSNSNNNSNNNNNNSNNSNSNNNDNNSNDNSNNNHNSNSNSCPFVVPRKDDTSPSVESPREDGPEDVAEVDSLLSKGQVVLSTAAEEAFYSSAVLIRLPALAEFVASAPRAALGHELCGLAFC